MAENKILISIQVDDKGTVVLKQFGDESKKAIKGMEGPLAGLKEGWIGLTAKIAAATAVIYGAQRVFKSFISEAAEAEQIENRLRYTIEGVGYNWQNAKVAVDQYTESIMRTTRFSDDQARQALNDMFLYTSDFTKAQQGATMAMDLAVRKNMDLGSATRYVGMGMTGNIEMLGRMLPEFKHLSDTLGENASMSDKAAYFFKMFQEKFGGTAPADIKTYSGQIEQLTNQWRELKKTVGGFVIEPITEKIKDLKDFVESIRKIVDLFKPPKTDAEALKKELEAINNQIKIMEFHFQRRAAGDILFKVSTEAAEEQSKKYDEILKRRSEIQKIIEEGKPPSKPDTFAAREFPIFKMPLDMWDYFKKAPGFIEIINDGVVQEVLSVAQLNEKLKNEIELKEQLMDLAPKMDRWEFEAGYGPPAGYVRDVGGGLISMADAVERNKILEDFKNIQTKIIDSWEFEGTEPLGQISARGRAQEAFEKTKEIDKFWTDTATSMGQSFISGFFNIFTSGIKNAGDAFKQFGMNLINSFSNVVQQLISNWLVFGSIMGSSGYTTGQKFEGLLGLLNIFKAQEGFSGMVNRPTGFIAGEGGREFVNIIPESKMSGAGGGQTINNFYYINLNAIDTQNMDQALRRNSGSIVKIVKTNIDRNGPLRGK